MAAAKTTILTPNAPVLEIQAPLGFSTGTTYYTAANTEGKPGRVGTDGAAETGKFCPISDVSTQFPIGLFDPNFSKNAFDPAAPEYFNLCNGQLNLIKFPVTIVTDNLTAGNLPTEGGRIWLADANTFQATVADSVYHMGLCLGTDPNDSNSRILLVNPNFLS